MIREAYFLGAYWNLRQERLEDITARAARMVECMKAAETSLEVLVGHPGDKRKFPFSAERVEKAFAFGRNRRDSDQSIIEDLGYRTSFTLIHENTFVASLSIWAGGYSPYGVNKTLFDFESSANKLWSPIMLRHLLDCVISSWEPEHALVTGTRLQRTFRDEDRSSIHVGYLSFFNSIYEVSAPENNIISFQNIDEVGNMILVTTDFDPDNPAIPNSLRQVNYKRKG